MNTYAALLDSGHAAALKRRHQKAPIARRPHVTGSRTQGCGSFRRKPFEARVAASPYLVRPFPPAEHCLVTRVRSADIRFVLSNVL
jgi:hypothetical protein